MFVVDPYQFQKSALEEEASVRRALTWVCIRGALDKACIHQTFGLWCTQGCTNEGVMEVKRHLLLFVLARHLRTKGVVLRQGHFNPH
jgi:hypothetical protein